MGVTSKSYHSEQATDWTSLEDTFALYKCICYDSEIHLYGAGDIYNTNRCISVYVNSGYIFVHTSVILVIHLYI